jgi:hypothetical protein
LRKTLDLSIHLNGGRTVTYRKTKRKLAESLWLEIEKAILQSPGVRHSYKKLQAFDPKGDPAKYNLSLNIKKLGELIESDEQNLQKLTSKQERPNSIF